MTEAERAMMVKEVACCKEAAAHCHLRAAMAWTDDRRDGWRAMAAENERLAGEREEKLAADAKATPAAKPKRAKKK